MAITFSSFVDWSGFQPGPLFPEARNSFDTRRLWATSIPANVKTSLTPALPSVLERPHRDEWSDEVSTIEWKTLAPIWTTVAEQILVNDPVFRAFQSPWYVSADGQWTSQFRKHPTFDVLREELVVRLEDEFETNRKFISDVEAGAPRLTGEVGSGSGSESAPAGDEEFSTQGWGWIKTAYKAVKVGRVFSPAGVGWMVVEHTAEYAYHKYRERQERQERERRRAERRENYRRRREVRELQEITLPYGDWIESLDQQVRGFTPTAPTIGLFAIEGQSAQYKWRGLLGSPPVIVSQDGVYL